MKSDNKKIGSTILNFAKKIININRSLTGEGNRKTLKILKTEIKNLQIKSFPSNKKVFDWVIPKEWEIKDAFIITPEKKKICELKKNFLNVVSYSKPIKKFIKLKELKKNLITLKNKPNSIPYATTYYKKNWGFCLSYNQYRKLKEGKYFVNINSKFINGKLDYGELIIPGKSSKEILLSTYICHPNLANNETSGISLLTFITKWILKKNKNYTYRIIFAPETIGTIAYLHKNFKKMKKKVVAGYVLTCVGDDRNFSYLKTRDEYHLTNKVALHILKHISKKPKIYDWTHRGSDERQYCSPNINLPVGVLMKTKFGSYKEYHTSDDKIGKVVNSKGFEGSYNFVKKIIEGIEENFIPIQNIKCEPFFEKRKINYSISNEALNILREQSDYQSRYFKLSGKINNDKETKLVSRILISNVLWLCDGKNDSIDISNFIGLPIWEVSKVLNILLIKKILKKKKIN